MREQNFKEIDLGGVGIGLTISARVVKLMGGDLDFESREGEGTKFFFNIDLHSEEFSDSEIALTLPKL